MRVLVVADVVGGVRTFVHELTGGLTRLGAEVHLALIGRDASVAAPAAASCELRDLKLEWMADPWRDVEATSDWVGELVAHHRPDVVHMNTFAPVPDGGVPVLLTVHSCVVTWWRAVHGSETPAGWTRYRTAARLALDRANAVCAPTRALLEELIAAYGKLRGARVIPNGRTIAQPLPEPQDCRERLVVCVGRLWDEAKNAALLASAAPAIDGHVVLIGPGGVCGIESLGGLRSAEVLGWFRRAAVFAEPARYEPFGLAALEAALCGCALVLGDIPSLREVWQDAASFVRPDDRQALVDAINALLGDFAHWRDAANVARARAALYTQSAMSSAYLDAYREVARFAIPA
ncbi:MAG: glycosyltransferase family 4 protein [Solirubrobacterales bacterium]|nr:glycosyltransferase family 4 protein [Solirubrobacterales bacterium]MBV9943290.1 glycosyltransferase family 4 protein [Solirubrobacterales bacterium]